jgi:hypothetical protein
MNESMGTTIVEKEGHGSWNALWALGGFAAGYLVNGGRFGNGCGGNCNGCSNACSCGYNAGPYGAASATAIYQQGIMEGKNTAGIDFIAQSNASTAQEMRNGFAQVNAQFTNILDREYQKVLAENSSLKNSNALCSSLGPITNTLVGLTNQVGCLQKALGNSFVYSKDICGNCNG